jgi:phosphoethanolamine N-methyltransferase
MSDIKKLIEEYSEEYCLFLEAAYGSDMMSEGGTVAIDRMLAGCDLHKKNVMDIGAGLGGAAFYVGSHYQANVTGLELGTWMVDEATRRTPAQLKSSIKFLAYDPPTIQLADASFDIIYSKGVLTHVKDKLPLFREVFRILKPHGYFIIDDWLSPVQNKWGARLQKMCEIENLTLYAETETNYKKILQQSGFEQIEVRDENSHYAKYNQDIINRMQSKSFREKFKALYEGMSLQQSVECYELIRDSIKDNELLIRWFKCKKNSNTL